MGNQVQSSEKSMGACKILYKTTRKRRRKRERKWAGWEEGIKYRKGINKTGGMYCSITL
jgi:hypothetical protein